MPFKRPVKSSLLLAALLAACPHDSAAQWIARPLPSLRRVEDSGVSFTYRAADFGKLTVKTEPRLTAQEIGDGIPVGQGPAARCFYLEPLRPLPALEKGGRYFFPSDSFVCVYPLADSSVADFAGAYPMLSQAAASLRRILRARPRAFGRLDRWGKWDGIPDYPNGNASYSVRSKTRYLDSRSLSGILFLAQYSQDRHPSPANNEELTYIFQGLTRDGRHYVAARFAVTHPRLPRGIDFTEFDETDDTLLYLRRDERKLDRLREETFQPSLDSLRALLASLSIS